MRLFKRATFVAVAVLTIAACGGDDNSGPNDNGAVNATYNLKTVDGQNVPVTEQFTDGESTFDVTFQSGNIKLKSDNSFTETLNVTVDGTAAPQTDSGTYVIDGSNITFTFASDGSTETGTLSGNNMTLTDPNLDVTFVLSK